MKIEKVERVGNVRMRHIRSGGAEKPVYSDGQVERELYEAFRTGQIDTLFRDGQGYSSWPHEYHLSPYRLNLLSWYPFDNKGELLEVGSGCGALTGLLCDKVKRVVALEYSDLRASVTAHRHSQRSNLEVVVGGFQDYHDDSLFDYITVIGVLEYAGKFYGGDSPYESFLRKTFDLLKPDGTLILAIENKIGLKYLAGAPEDHTARVFESIYNYPYPIKIATFSRKELSTLLQTAGFSGLEWYYPIPDYKMPRAVLSDEMIPRDTDAVWLLYPARPRKLLGGPALAERWFAKTLAHAGLLSDFANSFLVVAKKGHGNADSLRCIRFSAANRARKPEFRVNNKVCTDGKKKYFIRSPDNPEAVTFCSEIIRREALSQEFFRGKAEVVTGRSADSSLSYDFIELPSLEELIGKSIKADEPGFGRSLLEEYRQFLHGLPSRQCIPEQFMQEFGISSHEISQPLRCLTCAPIDCIPRNILVGPQDWYIIDNEWTYDFALPIDYLFFRAIFTLVVDLQFDIQTRASKDLPVVLLSGYGDKREYIPSAWLEMLDTSQVPPRILIRWETQFQNRVLALSRNQSPRLSRTPKVFTKIDAGLIYFPGWKRLCRVRPLFSHFVGRLSRSLRSRNLRLNEVQ